MAYRTPRCQSGLAKRTSLSTQPGGSDPPQSWSHRSCLELGCPLRPCGDGAREPGAREPHFKGSVSVQPQPHVRVRASAPPGVDCLLWESWFALWSVRPRCGHAVCRGSRGTNSRRTLRRFVARVRVKGAPLDLTAVQSVNLRCHNATRHHRRRPAHAVRPVPGSAHRQCGLGGAGRAGRVPSARLLPGAGRRCPPTDHTRPGVLVAQFNMALGTDGSAARTCPQVNKTAECKCLLPARERGESATAPKMSP
jgi:hypothetical protein